MRCLSTLAAVQDFLQALDTKSISTFNASAVARFLRACASSRALAQGRRLHEHIASRGMDSGASLGIPLLNMYYKCGCVREAKQVFDHLKERDVVAWTTLICVFAQNGHSREAFVSFRQMQMEGTKPNQLTFVSILRACNSPWELSEGAAVHACIAEDGDNEANILVSNALVSMYAKCGNVAQAERLFRDMPLKDLISWNSIIAGFSRYMDHEANCMKYFHAMQLEGLNPNSMTLGIVLNVCTRLDKPFSRGRTIHGMIVQQGILLSHSIGTALINLYGKSGHLEDAVLAFETMEPEGRTVVTWNALISAHIQNGDTSGAVHVYKGMQQAGITPTKVTFVTVLRACASPGFLTFGRVIHEAAAASGLEGDLVLGSAFINMYDSCGSIAEAESLFERLTSKNTVSWNAMLTAYVQHGVQHGPHILLKRMLWEGARPDKVTFVTTLNACTSLPQLMFVQSLVAEAGEEYDTILGSALVNLQGKYGSLEEARRIFDGMKDRDVVAWNALIAAYAHSGYYKEALQVFNEMENVIAPNEFTFIATLEVCTNMVSLADGTRVCDMIPEVFRGKIAVGIAIVNLFGKCGHLYEAKKNFDQLVYHDVVSWSSLISANAQHGHPHEAVHLVKVMQQEGVEPNHVTLVSVLAACSHAGLLEEGHHYFLTIIRDGEAQAILEHYRCVADMLCRAGKLDEAENFLKKVPVDLGAVAWMTLLTACKNYGDTERAKRTAELAIQKCPASSAGYVALSNAV